MKTLRRLLPFLKPYRGRLALSITLSALVAMLSTLTFMIIEPIMKLIFPDGTGNAATTTTAHATGFAESFRDSLLGFFSSAVLHPGDRLASLRNLCILIIVIFALKNVVKYAGALLQVWIEESMMRDVRDRLFGNTLGLSLGFFHTKRAGELMSVVTNDVGVMNIALTPTLRVLVQEPLQVIAMLLVLLSISPMLTLIAFSSSILSLLMFRVLMKSIKRYSVRIQDAMSDVTSRLQESFQNVRIIKGYAAEEYETKRFMRETSNYVRSITKHARVTNLLNPTSEMFAIIALGVVLFYGGLQVIDGSMNGAELFTFLFLLFGIMQPINTVLTTPGMIQRGIVAAERVLELLDTQPTVREGTKNAPLLRHELQLLNVEFGYRSDQTVIRDATLTVKRGQTVALVGPSGGGKSTLMDLIARFYDPDDGGIYLDGVDIREFDLKSYRSTFGIVTQESFLFNDTVRNNIAYAADVTDEMVIAAAKTANAHEFISRLPQGYDTMIGDRGVLLSGGQRQRLAIARALVRDPQILLFDEATSALDTESEMLVQEAINNLLTDRTAIVIAHRLSTIKTAHQIAVIQDGEIVERGTHGELLEAGKLYRKLYDVQFRDE